MGITRLETYLERRVAVASTPRLDTTRTVTHAHVYSVSYRPKKKCVGVDIYKTGKMCGMNIYQKARSERTKKRGRNKEKKISHANAVLKKGKNSCIIPDTILHRFALATRAASSTTTYSIPHNNSNSKT